MPEQRLVLGRHPNAAARARGFVQQQLGEWGSPTSRDYAVLLVSELVCDAVRHAGTGVDVTLEVSAERVRVAVCHAGSSGAGSHPPDGEAAFGRALAALNVLADAWGVGSSPEGRTVWYSVRAGR
jgi:hypothetical protein